MAIVFCFRRLNSKKKKKHTKEKKKSWGKYVILYPHRCFYLKARKSSTRLRKFETVQPFFSLQSPPLFRTGHDGW